MIFDIKNYKGKYVMLCKTKKEADEFCNYLHNIGKSWCNCNSYKNHTNWHSYKEDTCYNFNDDCYETVQYYIERDYTILEWSDFTTEFTKADLKDGMVVEYNDGSKGFVFNKVIMTMNSHIELSLFDENMKHINASNKYIRKVYTSSATFLSCLLEPKHLTLIWERKEEPKPVEMTLEEICKALGKEIKIVKG